VKPIGDDSFTIVLLPDTQHYVEEGKYSKNLECFESQIQWIIEKMIKLLTNKAQSPKDIA